jgi:hypothetical protein
MIAIEDSRNRLELHSEFERRNRAFEKSLQKYRHRIGLEKKCENHRS